MRAIRRFNSVVGTGNPVFITDVTYGTELTGMLGNMLNTFGRSAYITGGFDAQGVNAFTPGVVWFDGQLYAYEGESVPGGQYLFAGVRESDQRVTVDGQTYSAYTEYYLFTGAGNSSPNGQLVHGSVISAAMIASLKAPLIPDGGITRNMLGANTITGDKVVDGAISNSKIAANAVTTDKIAANAVTTDKIAANAVTTSKIANRTITGDKIAEQTITTNNIEDDAVLNNKAGFPTIIAAGNVFFDSSTYPNIRRSNKGALCYVTRLSAGQYSLSFNPDSTGFMIVSAANAADYIVRAIGMSSPFTVIMKNLTGGYVDVEFNFCLIRM